MSNTKYFLLLLASAALTFAVLVATGAITISRNNDCGLEPKQVCRSLEEVNSNG